jgi:hypothetical protein
MKPNQLFSATMPFVWAKLGLGLGAFLIAAVVIGICIGIGMLLIDSIGAFIIIIGIIIGIGIYRFIMRTMGYAIRVGHVAVLTETIKTGQVPSNQVQYGKDIVVSKFATAGVFFILDALVEKSIKQLQNGLGSIFGLIAGLPGMDKVVQILQIFVDIALRTVDECVLGWIFYNQDKGENAFKGAADGIVIYFQNWKKVLGNAAKSTAIVVVVTALVTLVLGGLFYGMLSLFNVGAVAIVAFVIAFLLALAVKTAVLDSYVMVQMIHAYMAVAPSTEIKFDLYTKLSGLSKSFRELVGKANVPQGQQYAMAGGGAVATVDAVDVTPAPVSIASSTPVAKATFCGECGAKNEAGTKFCGECGKAL